MVMKWIWKTKMSITCSEKEKKVKSGQSQRREISKSSCRDESVEKDSISDENISIDINYREVNGSTFQNMNP